MHVDSLRLTFTTGHISKVPQDPTGFQLEQKIVGHVKYHFPFLLGGIAAYSASFKTNSHIFDLIQANHWENKVPEDVSNDLFLIK